MTILAAARTRPWFLNFGCTMATRTVCEDDEIESRVEESETQRSKGSGSRLQLRTLLQPSPGPSRKALSNLLGTDLPSLDSPMYQLTLHIWKPTPDQLRTGTRSVCFSGQVHADKWGKGKDSKGRQRFPDLGWLRFAWGLVKFQASCICESLLLRPQHLGIWEYPF